MTKIKDDQKATRGERKRLIDYNIVRTCPIFYLNIIMQEEDDERAAQALRDYDSLFVELTEAITEFNLPKPALFEREADHTCLNFFNKGAEGQEAEGQDREREERKQEGKKKSAAKLIGHLVDHNKLDSLAYKKTKGYEGIQFDTKNECDYVKVTEVSFIVGKSVKLSGNNSYRTVS